MFMHSFVQFPAFSCADVSHFLPKMKRLLFWENCQFGTVCEWKSTALWTVLFSSPPPTPPSSSEVFSPSLFSCQISELCLACKYWTRSKGSHLAFSSFFMRLNGFFFVFWILEGFSFFPLQVQLFYMLLWPTFDWHTALCPAIPWCCISVCTFTLWGTHTNTQCLCVDWQ